MNKIVKPGTDESPSVEKSVAVSPGRKSAFLAGLLGTVDKPIHKKILGAYNPDDPTVSMETELSKILIENSGIMKIKSIKIRGFRGFNDEREILFDDRLTLVSAVNSYGKTSISEAFEWLLYGQTSKVEKADSKDEYKGSYINCHPPATLHPIVALELEDSGVTNTLRADLIGDAIQRSLNGAFSRLPSDRLAKKQEANEKLAA
jgi:hypothetical protein